MGLWVDRNGMGTIGKEALRERLSGFSLGRKDGKHPTFGGNIEPVEAGVKGDHIWRCTDRKRRADPHCVEIKRHQCGIVFAGDKAICDAASIYNPCG